MLVKEDIKNKKTMFVTNETGLKKYNNQECKIIRPLTEKEADIHEVGNMYKIQFKDGYITDAFEDELITDI